MNEDEIITRDVIRMSRYLTGKYCRNFNMADDVDQEGLIAYWKTIKLNPKVQGDLRTYAFEAMAKQIITRYGRDSWTGNERPKGAAIDPLRRDARREHSVLYFDQEIEQEDQQGAAIPLWDTLHNHEPAVDEQVIRRDEITRLIKGAGLTEVEKRVLFGRGYYGMTKDDMSEVWGLTSGTVSRKWASALRKIHEFRATEAEAA